MSTLQLLMVFFSPTSTSFNVQTQSKLVGSRSLCSQSQQVVFHEHPSRCVLSLRTLSPTPRVAEIALKAFHPMPSVALQTNLAMAQLINFWPAQDATRSGLSWCAEVSGLYAWGMCDIFCNG